jgi:CysZ protein
MKFFRDFGQGVLYFFRSWTVIFNKGMWHYLFYPLILHIIIYVLIVVGVFTLGKQLEDYLNHLFSFDSIPESGHWLSWMKPFLTGWLSWILVWVLKFFVAWILQILTKYIVLILLSPILSLASETAEEKVTGKKFPFDFGQLMKDILRGVLISLRNMAIEYGLFFAGFLLLLIPVLGPLLFAVYGVFMWFISWYFYGFSMLDYSCERHKMGVGASSRLIKTNKGVAIGIGFMFAGFLYVGSWIPVIGSMVAIMFAPIMGVVGGTLAFLDLKKQEEQKNAGIVVSPN